MTNLNKETSPFEQGLGGSELIMKNFVLLPAALFLDELHFMAQRHQMGFELVLLFHTSTS